MADAELCDVGVSGFCCPPSGGGSEATRIANMHCSTYFICLFLTKPRVSLLRRPGRRRHRLPLHRLPIQQLQIKYENCVHHRHLKLRHNSCHEQTANLRVAQGLPQWPTMKSEWEEGEHRRKYRDQHRPEP